MGQSSRWFWIPIGVLLAAIIGLGVYAWVLQSQLSQETTRLESELDRAEQALAARVATLEADVPEVQQTLSAQLTTAQNQLSADLTDAEAEFNAGLEALTTQLAVRATELAAQLDTLETALGQEITTQGEELQADIESAQTRLQNVQTELAAADATISEDVAAQAATLLTVSSDLDTLETDTAALMAKAARALLDVAPLYAQVKDSVVEVLEAGEVWGSGFVYGAEARYVVTAWHVVDGASSISVRLFNETEVSATVAGKNLKEDLAVLELSQALHNINPLPLADSAQLSVGQPVLVVGTPYEMKGTATTGIISALRGLGDFTDDFFWEGYRPTDLVQVDAAVNPGNSGGPIFNGAGEVIGIISWGFSWGDDSGLNFGPSSNVIKTLVDTIVGS